MTTRRAGSSARYIVTCDICGKDFWGQRRTAQYCGNACKQVAYRKAKEKREEAKKLQSPLF